MAFLLPIGGLYATYHLLGEPETTIELVGVKPHVTHDQSAQPLVARYLASLRFQPASLSLPLNYSWMVGIRWKFEKTNWGPIWVFPKMDGL